VNHFIKHLNCSFQPKASASTSLITASSLGHEQHHFQQFHRMDLCCFTKKNEIALINTTPDSRSDEDLKTMPENEEQDEERR